MALFSKRPTPNIEDLTRQLHFDEFQIDNIELRRTMLPPEWFPQSGIQLTWPHEGTDWNGILPEVTACYLRMAFEIATREALLIVTPHVDEVQRLLAEKLPQRAMDNIQLFVCPTNDTWARDHGFLTLMSEQGAQLLDFCFNGWGMKFAANLDNQINRQLMMEDVLNGRYANHLDFVLEGGAIESDGQGTLLTTSNCLLEANRNPRMEKGEIEATLKRLFAADRVLWLDYGYLAGDDTDSHIDTLARFCPNDTIAYVQCTDTADEHYTALHQMEEQLQTFRTVDNKPYELLPLPLPAPIFDTTDGQAERLPATYANFLIMNDAVLMPTYAQPDNDERARNILQKAFPKREVIGIDCRSLIKQHGSLHCCTMQFPVGVITPKNVKTEK